MSLSCACSSEFVDCSFPNNVCDNEEGDCPEELYAERAVNTVEKSVRECCGVVAEVDLCGDVNEVFEGKVINDVLECGWEEF